MAYNIKNKPVKEKKSSMKENVKSFYIDKHNYSWENDGKGTMKVSLGNMTDAGWYWNGNQNDLNGFLFRLNHSKVKDEFLSDVKSKSISFRQIKPQLLKSAEKNDGLYEMSGDNVVWHLGQIENDVDESYEIEEAGISKEKQDDVYSEYNPITYKEFEKENSKMYKEKIKKAIKESNSYEEFMEKQDEIQVELMEERMNENGLRFIQAINKVKEKKE